MYVSHNCQRENGHILSIYHALSIIGCGISKLEITEVHKCMSLEGFKVAYLTMDYQQMMNILSKE